LSLAMPSAVPSTSSTTVTAYVSIEPWHADTAAGIYSGSIPVRVEAGGQVIERSVALSAEIWQPTPVACKPLPDGSRFVFRMRGTGVLPC
jgi:hypothetical protein